MCVLQNVYTHVHIQMYTPFMVKQKQYGVACACVAICVCVFLHFMAFGFYRMQGGSGTERKEWEDGPTKC